MRFWILLSAVCVLTAFGSVGPGGPGRAGQPQPGFDAQEVVRHVNAFRDVMASRPGDSYVVQGELRNRFPEQPDASGDALPDNGEFLIDTNSTLVPTPGNQVRAAVAFDGANFLVVWEDRRVGSYSDICGARVTTGGTVLDPSGFVISQGAYDQRYPAVAFDGAGFFVAWDDYRRGHSFDIYGARVSTGGAVLDGTGIIITQEANNQQHPAIAFDGTDYLVVWEDDRRGSDSTDIYGARVTPAGVVVDTSAFVISDALQGQHDPGICFGGANFLVAWQDCRDSGYSAIFGARVTPAGAILDTIGLAISATPGQHGYPVTGYDGANFLVAWQDCRGSFPPEVDIYGSRVTPEGIVLDLGGIAIARAGGVQAAPAMTFDGTNFLAVWQDFRNGDNTDIYGARVTPGGAVLDPGGIAVSREAGVQGTPAVGFGGGNFLAVWQDARNNMVESDIFGTRVTPDGAVLDSSGFIITLAAREQSRPAVGYGGGNYLVVWEDYRNGSYSDIYGARVTSGGVVLDPDGIAIAQADGLQVAPDLGFDGSNFLVVWSDSRNDPDAPDIYGARVTPGGVVLDAGGLAIAQAARSQGSPALGFNGANFLAVWEDDRGGSYPDIYGARVTPEGTVLDPGGIAIAQPAERQLSPDVASDGANFLAVWEDRRGGSYSDIYGARVTSGGAVLDPDGIAVSRAGRDQVAPAVGFDGVRFLTAWEDYRRGIFSDIYGARVTPAGAVLDTAGIVITEATKYQYAPVLAFDGTRFLAAWEDNRASNNPDIYGAWVASDGTVADEGGVVRQSGNQMSLALAHGIGSELFLVYQGWAGRIGNKTYNTERIWGDMNPSTGSAVEERPNAEWRMTNSATIVRGVLLLPEASSHKPQGASLLDAGGRKALDLQPGANNVTTLSPGVYFVKDASSPTQKVVIQR